MKSSKVQAALLLFIIAVLLTAMGALAEEAGMLDVKDTMRAWATAIPWVRDKVATADPVSQTEIAELERLQVDKAREERWTQIRRTQEELKGAQEQLNQDRQRLAQWEAELERREKAINDREQEFTDREAQYEKAVQFYTAMRPANAAAILSQQDDILVMEIFRRMPERNVSAILAQMDPTVAGTIMRKMAR